MDEKGSREVNTSYLIKSFTSESRNGKTDRVLAIAVGFLVMVITGMTFVGWTEFAQSLSLPGKPQFLPFLVVYFSTAWLAIIYPVYLMCAKLHYKSAFNIKETFRDHLSVWSTKTGIKPGIAILKFTVLTCLWIGSHYTYVRALGIISAFDVTVLFATYTCFVYILSWTVLHSPFIAIRVVAIIFGLTGTILMSYKDGFGSATMFGTVLVPMAGTGLATFRILFIKLIGNVSAGQLAMFFSTLGIYTSLLMSPIVIALGLTGVEIYSNIPWEYLCGAAALLLAFTVTTSYSVLVTYPVFSSLGIIFGIPLCAVADILWKQFYCGGTETASASLILIGFVLNLLPSNWHITLLSVMNIKSKKQENNHVTGGDRGVCITAYSRRATAFSR